MTDLVTCCRMQVTERLRLTGARLLVCSIPLAKSIGSVDRPASSARLHPQPPTRSRGRRTSGRLPDGDFPLSRSSGACLFIPTASTVALGTLAGQDFIEPMWSGWRPIRLPPTSTSRNWHTDCGDVHERATGLVRRYRHPFRSDRDLSCLGRQGAWVGSGSAPRPSLARNLASELSDRV